MADFAAYTFQFDGEAEIIGRPSLNFVNTLFVDDPLQYEKFINVLPLNFFKRMKLSFLM